MGQLEEINLGTKRLKPTIRRVYKKRGKGNKREIILTINVNSCKQGRYRNYSKEIEKKEKE